MVGKWTDMAARVSNPLFGTEYIDHKSSSSSHFTTAYLA